MLARAATSQADFLAPTPTLLPSRFLSFFNPRPARLYFFHPLRQTFSFVFVSFASFHFRSVWIRIEADNMANDNMEVDAAEAQLKTMEHSEQHYFKRYGHLFPRPAAHCRVTEGPLREEEARLLTVCPL